MEASECRWVFSIVEKKLLDAVSSIVQCQPENSLAPLKKILAVLEVAAEAVTRGNLASHSALN